jgi:hypothetical protein
MASAAEAIEIAAGLIANRLIDGLQQSEQIASGNLESSIEPTFYITPTRTTIDVLMLPYGTELDRGRKPGTRPPVSALVKWLSYPNVRDRLNLRDLDIKNKEGVAYAIAKKIEREGTTGNHFIQNVVNDTDLWQQVGGNIGQGYAEDIAALIVARK